MQYQAYFAIQKEWERMCLLRCLEEAREDFGGNDSFYLLFDDPVDYTIEEDVITIEGQRIQISVIELLSQGGIFTSPLITDKYFIHIKEREEFVYRISEHDLSKMRKKFIESSVLTVLKNITA
jgi:hypothetical protein